MARALAGQPEDRSPTIGIRVLGGFSIEQDGIPLDLHRFGGRLALTLTKILLTRRGQVVPRDVLCELLWPQAKPADPGANLNALVHRARRALASSELIRTTPQGYLLDPDQRCVVDAEVFRASVLDGQADIQEARPGSGLRQLEHALVLWRGEPLPDDADSEWAQHYRNDLLNARGQAQESAASAALMLGDANRARDLARQLVEESPLHEPAHRLLARARLAAGDRPGALAALDTFSARLAQELGVDPSPETADLRLQVLRDEVAPPHGSGRTPRPPGIGLLPFVGRHQVLDGLTARLQRPRGGVVLVAGRAGSGKSRLLAEVAARAGLTTVTARAFLPERNTPWSLARPLLQQAAALDVDVSRVVPQRMMLALADLVPGLPTPVSPDVGPLNPEARRALTLEGGLRLLTAATAGGALVLIDDLQWADASSVHLLAIAVHRLEGASVIIAYRPEEVLDRTEVSGLLADLPSAGDVPTITLDRLTPEAVAELVADPELVSVLAAETDGSPFALAEAISTLEQEGLLRRGVAGPWQASSERTVDRARELVRDGQRRSIAVRVGRQNRWCRDLLSCLALLGREAPTPLLASVSGKSETEVFEALEVLTRAELIRWGERGWAPAHDLIGETVIDELTATQRASHQTRLAAALEGFPVAPGERARHLIGAGDRQAAAVALAADAHEQAARHADCEAARLAEAALSLDPPDPLRADLLEVRAETAEREGRLDAARADVRQGLGLAGSSSERALLLVHLARLALGAEDLGHASELVELAIVEAGHDAASRARALAGASVIDMNLQHEARAASRADEALHLFQDIGDGHGVADVLDGRAMAAFLAGQIRDGIEQFARAARLYRDLGDLRRVITPQSTRGHGLVFAGSPEEGLAETDAALELAIDLGYPEGQTYVRWHRSEALNACGRAAEAVEDAGRALRIAEGLGHRGWTATAHRALGVARQSAGDMRAAEEAFRASLATSSELPLFECWAHARLAIVLVAQHHLGEAERHVESALAHGPALGQYEARLANAHLCVARRAPDAGAVIADAIAHARAGGHEASVSDLGRLLLTQPPGS